MASQFLAASINSCIHSCKRLMFHHACVFIKPLYDGFTVSCCIHKFMHPFMQKINVPSCMCFHQAPARFTRMMEDLSNCSLYWSVWKEIGCICVPWFVVHTILWSCIMILIMYIYICLYLAPWCHATLRGKAHALSSGFTSLRKCHYCSSEVSSPTCFGTCRVCVLCFDNIYCLHLENHERPPLCPCVHL